MKIFNKIWRKTECPSPTYVLFNKFLIMKQDGKFMLEDLIPRYLRHVSQLEKRDYYYWLHYSIVKGK